MFGWGMFAGVVVGIVLTVIFMIIVDNREDRKEKKMTGLQSPNAWERKEAERLTTYRPEVVDAPIIRIEDTPTWSDSLNQTRRDWRPDTNGLGGLYRILVNKMAAQWQLEAETEIAGREKELRHKINILETDHAEEEKMKAIAATLRVRDYAISEVIGKARAYVELLRELGIDDAEIEMKVKRILMQSLDQLGLRMLDTDISE